MSAAKDWVLRKRGVFYRPNSQGYTTSIHEAGRYTEAEAGDHVAHGCEPPVTAHRASDFLPTGTGAWSQMVAPIVAKCEVGAKFGSRVYFNRDGADALGLLLKRMAAQLDGAGALQSQGD